jgi:Zn-dependent protease with chaperone function
MTQETSRTSAARRRRAVGDLIRPRSGRLGALGLGAQFGVLMPFSRKHEAEADGSG